MASLVQEITVDAPVQDVWEAVRDFGALHRRLVPGFVTDAHLDGDCRVVTFVTGAVLRERLVALDDDRRRLVWTIVDGPYDHHNGAVDVTPAHDGRTRLVWTTDLLPDAAADQTAASMELGMTTMKRTLEEAAARRPPSR